MDKSINSPLIVYIFLNIFKYPGSYINFIFLWKSPYSFLICSHPDWLIHKPKAHLLPRMFLPIILGTPFSSVELESLFFVSSFLYSTLSSRYSYKFHFADEPNRGIGNLGKISQRHIVWIQMAQPDLKSRIHLTPNPFSYSDHSQHNLWLSCLRDRLRWQQLEALQVAENLV